MDKYIQSGVFHLIVEKEHKRYTLSNGMPVGADGWEFWLTNEEGEGMSVSGVNLFDILDRFFKENF